MLGYSTCFPPVAGCEVVCEVELLWLLARALQLLIDKTDQSTSWERGPLSRLESLEQASRLLG